MIDSKQICEFEKCNQFAYLEYVQRTSGYFSPHSRNSGHWAKVPHRTTKGDLDFHLSADTDPQVPTCMKEG